MKNANILSVIIAAAGESRRLDSSRRKPFVRLKGLPILFYSLQTFASLRETAEIIVAVNGRDIPAALSMLSPLRKKFKISGVVEGGEERFDSVRAALFALSADAPFVAVHDAARPFASAKLIRSVLAAARRVGAAVPAVELSDAVKTVKSGGLAGATLERGRMRAIQTPQIFRRERLLAAYRRAAQSGVGARFLDDAQVLEAAGRPVALVPGERLNVKITHPEDLVLAGAIASALRARK